MGITDEMRDVKMDEPSVPLDWPKTGALSRALAVAAYIIRKKNRAAVVNPATGLRERVPLD